MKNILLIILICFLAACKTEQPPKDYAVVFGTIKNPKDSINLRLFNPETSKSIILKVDKNGNFRDTLKLEKPANFNAVYNNVFAVYLANNMELQINFDANQVQKTITYKGNGEEENNFLKYKTKHLINLFGTDYKDYLGKSQTDFDATTKTFTDAFYAELDKKTTVLDSAFVANEKATMEKFKQDMVAQHKQQLEINAKLGKGKPSPDFKNYLNYNGGTSSLADFKGSYVYIDVWATWCVPCVYEIPFLEKVEKQFEGKNIKFVSISVDQKKDEQKWRNMIKDKNMHGIQLLADNADQSQFMTDYYIFGIPRFILLDPNGNIVNYDAPRPSEEKLIQLLNSIII